MSVIRLHGDDAIEYAKKHDLTVHKEATDQQGPRHHLSPDEAEAIAKDNPKLIWLEVEADVNTAGHE